MARSTFKVLFYLKRQNEKNGKVPVMGRITVNGTIAQFSCKLNIRLALWDTEANKASGKSVEAQRINEKLEISRPISASNINGSATGIHTLRPKRFAMLSSVWATTAACYCRPSTNTLQVSSNA